MDLTVFAVVWAMMAATVLGLAGYRWRVGQSEDDTVHLRDEEVRMVQEQVVVANRLEKIDRWEKMLIWATVVFGIALAAAYGYQKFMESSRLPI